MKFVGVSAPAWSIRAPSGLKLQKEEEPEDVRAIVDVDALSRKHVHVRPPTMVFGTGGRSSSEANLKTRPNTAGPVVTESAPRIARPASSKHGTISKAKRFGSTRDSEATPAPSYYAKDLSRPLSSMMPNFSMPYKYNPDADKTAHVVGPGQYEPNYSVKESKKHAIFGKEKKESLKELTVNGTGIPGPGSYEVPKERPNSSSTKGTFGVPKSRGTSARPRTASETRPGTSADYNVVQHTIEYRAQRVRAEAEMKNPSGQRPAEEALFKGDAEGSGSGTGTIGFNGNKPNAPAWGFGSGTRPPLNGVPQFDIAPGEYFGQTQNPRAQPGVKDKATVPRAKRRPLTESEKTPGVGAYELRKDTEGGKPVSLLGGPMYSFRGKFPSMLEREIAMKPGPGQHDLEGNVMENWRRGVLIGLEKRQKAAKRFFQPGPGSYQIRTNGPDGTVIKFPKARRAGNQNGTDPDIEIGPGHYILKPTVPQLQPHEVLNLMKKDRAQFLDFNV